MFYSNELGEKEGRGGNHEGLSTNSCQLLHHFLKEQVSFCPGGLFPELALFYKRKAVAAVFAALHPFKGPT